MKKPLILLSFLACCASCATITKSQLKAVNHFAKVNENFSAYPSKIIYTLADIRVKRGVYFANSLDAPELHINELDDLYNSRKEDYAVSKKVDITFQIIDKYTKSLLLLTADKYTRNLDSLATGFGTNLDSLSAKYNAMENVQKVPMGIGGAIGELVAFGGRQYIKTRQAKEIKKFVPQADTLIAVMTENLLEFLQSTNIIELINNEEKGVRSNYLSFLRQAKTVASATSRKDTSLIVSNTRANVENDREYMFLKADIDAVKKLREQTIKATKNLRSAHRKLAASLQKKHDLKEVIWEFQELYEGVADLKSTIDEIEKPSK